MSTAKDLPSSGWIVGPLEDRVFFIYSPLIALLIGVALSFSQASQVTTMLGGRVDTPVNFFIAIFIYAHLVLVLFRSHGNQKIFKLHPWRFTAVPVALFAACYCSMWVAAFVFVIGIWWDVYHSALQTFGLGRIYDAKAGNEPTVGRRLDYLVNILRYLGPILAGATLMNHIREFGIFRHVGSTFFTAIPAKVQSNQRYLVWLVTGVGLPFLAYYMFSYWRLYRQGYKVSPQKVCLLTSTGICSIYSWGFNIFGQAFFIMNFFHALQYFAIVWWAERRNVTSVFRVGTQRRGQVQAFTLFILLPCAYGYWVATTPNVQNDLVFCIALVVSIMHFWYDGFIWSVRKKQI